MLKETKESDLPCRISTDSASVADLCKILSQKGLVYWRMPNAADGKGIIAFRPFNYELDTSVLGSLHH